MLIIQGDVFFCTFPYDFNTTYIYMKYFFGLAKFVKKKHKHAKVIDLLRNFRLNSLYCLAGMG